MPIAKIELFCWSLLPSFYTVQLNFLRVVPFFVWWHWQRVFFLKRSGVELPLFYYLFNIINIKFWLVFYYYISFYLLDRIEEVDSIRFLTWLHLLNVALPRIFTYTWFISSKQRFRIIVDPEWMSFLIVIFGCTISRIFIWFFEYRKERHNVRKRDAIY